VGLVGGKGFAVDPSLIVADANKCGSTPRGRYRVERQERGRTAGALSPIAGSWVGWSAFSATEGRLRP
jgi:hypothetical protein